MELQHTAYAYAGGETPTVAPQGVTKRAGGMFLQALAGGTPGSWSSDHRKESEVFNHWNGIAIHQLCLQLQQADCAVYQDLSTAAKRKRRSKAYTTQDESQEVPETHDLVKLLKRPNQWESGSRFRYKIGLQMQLTGKAMIWNVPNMASKLGIGTGKTVQRIVIPTALATPVQPSNDLPFGGWRIQPMSNYWGSDPQGFVEMFGGATLAMGKVVPHEQMQVIDWPHPLFVDDGCSPTARGSRWIDGETQVGIAQWAQLKNGADPSLFVSIPDEVQWDPEIAKRYQEEMAGKYGGPQNAGRVMMMQGDVKPISTTPRDMAYTEAFIQYRDAIMALHGAIPIEADSYASFFAKVKQYTELTVQPVLDLIAEQDTERLAKEHGDGLTIEYTARSIDDPEVINNEITTLVAARAIKVDEVRTKMGLPPLGGPEGEAMAGQPQATTAMNVTGGLSLGGQQPGGFGLSLGTSDTSGASGMPSLSLPASNGGGAMPPRLSLNGKHHTNGHGGAWKGYP